jgi:hypothetical protein
MGDAGEGLIDADARIQERLEDLARQREANRNVEIADPEAVRALESLRLAGAEIRRQIASTPHERRRAQLQQALEEVERRMREIAPAAAQARP